LCWRIFIDYPRLLVAHFVASSLAFAFATFFRLAPRLALAELLAVGFVFSPYLERVGMYQLETRSLREADVAVVLEDL